MKKEKTYIIVTLAFLAVIVCVGAVVVNAMATNAPYLEGKNPPEIRAVLAKVRREHRERQKLGATAGQATAPSNKHPNKSRLTLEEANVT
jgi:hypothetical protein